MRPEGKYVRLCQNLSQSIFPALQLGGQGSQDNKESALEDPDHVFCHFAICLVSHFSLILFPPGANQKQRLDVCEIMDHFHSASLIFGRKNHF